MVRLAPLTGVLALCVLLPVPGAPPSAPAEDEDERVLKEAEGVQRQILELVEAVRPSSVTVLNYQPRGGAAPMLAGSGSGVIIRSEGLVLTNEHVVKGASRIEVVLLDGRRLPATVENRVAQYDIALLQVRDDKGKPMKGLKPARMGRSASLRTGQWVVATGNPFFLAQSGRAVVTLGAVSGLNRVTGGEFLYGNAIQHDAEINPGNSGGPLWNSQGELLGINGKIASRAVGLGASSTGVGFTIPIDQIQNFMKDLLGSGAGASVDPGDLGIAVETAKDEKGREVGARVTAVREGSAAATNKGGALQKGDVIQRIEIRFKSAAIRNATEYLNVMSVWPEGTRIDCVEVRRGGSPRSLSGFVLGPPAAKPKEPPK